MPASERKLLVHLALLCLVIATVNAKSLPEPEVEKTNYFEDMLNKLDNMKNLPIVGDSLRPIISQIYNRATEIDQWSDGSLSSLVNSIFPCEFNRTVLMCTGTLDRESLQKLIMKILGILPVGNSMIPMLELATKMVV